MNYYEVQPATNKYFGGVLTYSFPKKLKTGQIVEIEVRKTACLGVILRSIQKPNFKTKDIDKQIENLSLSEQQQQLFEWFKDYYPGNESASMNLFVPSYLANYTTNVNSARVQNTQIEKLDLKTIKPKLNPEQHAGYKKIAYKKETFILRGVTGSGKTRIYLELARDQIQNGKSVLILTPEIALTAPLERQFKDIFGSIVFTNHSHLTPKQKLELHKKLYSKENPVILMGPRSSLFLPLDNLGLIVVDEFHETSYKQDTSPRYHASRVAGKLSELTKSSLILGSATPPISDYYLAEQKNRTIINLNTSAITNKKPAINKLVINLADKNEQTSYPLISKSALREISASLDRSEQVLVYINKRGSFRSVLCRQCAWQLQCISCELPMIYHQDTGFAICHTCGQKKDVPKSCPSCKSIEIFFTSPGTKLIADNLAKAFPKAKVKRFDKDNKKSERIENDYAALESGEIDIIVGTQMVAKGFDLPKLSLVVILIAESSLNFPDYTATERSYQIIKQLSGRVNRGHREGMVLLQTFNPKSEVISYIKKDWINFYKEELAKRKALGFPPLWNSAKLQVSNKNRGTVEKILNKLVDELKIKHKNLRILGPSPSFIEKKKNEFQWHIVIMSKDRKTLAQIVQNLPRNYTVDMDPNNFL